MLRVWIYFSVLDKRSSKLKNKNHHRSTITIIINEKKRLNDNHSNKINLELLRKIIRYEGIEEEEI